MKHCRSSNPQCKQENSKLIRNHSYIVMAFPLWLMMLFFSVPETGNAQLIDRADIIVTPAPETGEICILDPTGTDEYFYRSAREMRARYFANQSANSANFEIDYVNSCGGQTWPQQARTAIEYAFEIWSTHLSSDIPIRIEANWIALAENTLGSAGPTQIVRFDAAEAAVLGALPNTWYTIAQASAMLEEDLVSEFDAGHDVVMNINCQWSSWYFDTDANPPPGQIDLVSVVLHEIGHGIGFLGSMSANNDTEIGSYGFGNDDFPIIFDHFAEDGNEIELLNTIEYSNPSAALYQALTGQRGGVFFDGSNSTLANEGANVRLHTPLEWNGGSSYSHLDQNTYTGTENALMRPSIPGAFAIHSPGPIFCGMLGDWGWPLGPDCRAFVAADASIFVTDLSNFELNELRFGVTNIGLSVSQTFTIENDINSAEPLSYVITIENINYRLANSGENSSRTLEPGESVDITILYDPENDRVHNGTVRIQHNAQNQASPITISLLGEALLENEVARLEQNFPNPFNPETTIPFVLPEQANVRLDIFSIDGRLVKTLVNSSLPSGRYEDPYNLSDLASGMYLYRLIVNNFADTKKLLIVK